MKKQAMKKKVLKKDNPNDAFRAVPDVSQERVALQGGESSQERTGNLVAEISQVRPGVLAGECSKEITNDAGDKIIVN